MNIQKAILEAQSKDWVAIQRERDILNGNFFVLMGGVIGESLDSAIGNSCLEIQIAILRFFKGCQDKVPQFLF